jgi:hypothetical protein
VRFSALLTSRSTSANNRRRQRIQRRATAEMIVHRLAAHQGDQAGELRGVLSSVVTVGMHDEARWESATD